ncbi:FtsX-like permease family protein [bacterium]|nr:MAG: FtsX-like permease family protein [bacterium]
MIDRISFIFGEAIAGIRRNVGMSMISVAMAALALLMLGSVFIVTKKLDEAASSMTGKFDMTAYMKEGVTRADVNETIKEIRGIPYVAKAVWVPRDKYWDKIRKEKGLDYSAELENPIQEGFKVVLTNLRQGESVAKAIRALPKIDRDKVEYMSDEMRTLEEFQRVVNWTGGVVGFICFFISGVLVFNTTRLAIANRRAEIRIMRLIGAHWLTVDFPFLVEGVIFGAMGGVLATGAIGIGYLKIGQQIMKLMPGGTVAPFEYVATMQALSLTGAAFGLVCAALAVWIPERKLRR